MKRPNDPALTEAQLLILRDLQRFPKRARLPSGAISIAALDHFDRRSLRGLFAKGLLAIDHNGNVKIVAA
jgi:hypothetical protein